MLNYRILKINILIITSCLIKYNSALANAESLLMKNCDYDYDDQMKRGYKLCKNITLSYNDEIIDYQIEEMDIRFINCNLKKFPKNFSKLFKGTRYIMIKNSSLEEYPYDFNTKLSHYLYTLILSNNKLKTFSNGCFNTEERLELLDLSWNQIQLLPGQLFSSLKSLKKLYLNNNQLIELNYDLFKMTKQLEVINLSYNQLIQVNDKLFEQNYYLKEIYLNNNKIKIIYNGLLSKINDLQIFDISNNPLKQFNFSNALTIKAENTELKKFQLNDDNVRNIYLNNNNIEKIIINTTNNFIEELYLSNNSLKEFGNIDELQQQQQIINQQQNGNNGENIPKLITITFDKTKFKGFQHLQRLDLSLNNISLNLLNLHNFKNLLYLNLSSALNKYYRNSSDSNSSNSSNNNINLHYDLFVYSQTVRELDLSNNNLKCINEQIFYPLINLNKLYVNNNSLYEFPYKSNRIIKTNNNNNKIQQQQQLLIDISNNKWNCSYLIDMLNHFQLNNIKLRNIDDFLMDNTKMNNAYIHNAAIKMNCIKDIFYINNYINHNNSSNNTIPKILSPDYNNKNDNNNNNYQTLTNYIKNSKLQNNFDIDNKFSSVIRLLITLIFLVLIVIALFTLIILHVWYRNRYFFQIRNNPLIELDENGTR